MKHPNICTKISFNISNIYKHISTHQPQSNTKLQIKWQHYCTGSKITDHTLQTISPQIQM